MYATQSLKYDVVILGATLASLSQARHLMLNIPNIKVALVDLPVQELENEPAINDSTIEIADLFFCKELGLHDYLIENHIPRSTLSFHWPKLPNQTTTLDDYYHIWCNRQLSIASYQINRPKFEQDLLLMNEAMGAIVYKGSVVDVELTNCDVVNIVKIQIADQEIALKADHVIDGAGRQFIIGRKTDNLLIGPQHLCGLNNGTAWLRVKNVNRTIFHNGYSPNETSTSRYYSTNHYFGYGHWLWMTPTDIPSRELSVGIVHYQEVLPAEGIDTQEKFLAFVQTNHNLLYQLIDSGEVIDFHYKPRIAYKSKKLFSEDNWYVIGNAASFFGGFYCVETTLLAFAVESVTEVIRAKLAGEADVDKKRSAYNEFNLYYHNLINHVYYDHAQQLGHASIMSWRIYLDWMWWFSIHVPTYAGKWHLNPEFTNMYLKLSYQNIGGFWIDLFKEFKQLVDQGANIGLMDLYRGDQLFGGYHTPKYFDNFLENTKFEPQRCNVFAGVKANFFNAAIWYALFQWKSFGLAGWLNSRHLYHFFRLLTVSGQWALLELSYRFKLKKGLSDNSSIEKMRQEFKNYQYRPELQPWRTEQVTQKNQLSQGELNRNLEQTKISAASAKI
ncbi:NAD(P)/FAD-dependent oxidoreductase [Nostoc sp.]|uniref:NAD(P)/FAD-dependent oxidoreductase n=1 Tax=Nostoc sp. TaxID=1180 RepID=UPI002FF71967